MSLRSGVRARRRGDAAHPVDMGAAPQRRDGACAPESYVALERRAGPEQAGYLKFARTGLAPNPNSSSSLGSIAHTPWPALGLSLESRSLGATHV